MKTFYVKPIILLKKNYALNTTRKIVLSHCEQYRWKENYAAINIYINNSQNDRWIKNNGNIGYDNNHMTAHKLSSKIKLKNWQVWVDN